MTLPLSSHSINQPLHGSSITSTPLKPYSATRQFTTAVHHAQASNGTASVRRSDHEVFKLSTGMNQREAPQVLHSSSSGEVTRSVTPDPGHDMGKPATPSQELPDLPSWTPLRSDLEPKEEDPLITDCQWKSQAQVGVTTRQETGSAMKWRASLPPAKSPTNAQTAETSTVTGQALKPSPPKKKARFDGVVISTKPPSYRKLRTQSRRAHAASNASSFNLVDALARTFVANRYPNDSCPSHVALRQPDDASTGLQTDTETTTEAEDERFQLHTRLGRPPLSLKRPRARGRPGDAAASLAQAGERLTKRPKAIPYDANTALIDAALGTVCAPVSWEAEVDTIARDDDIVAHAQAARIIPVVERDDAQRMDDAAADAATVTASAPPGPPTGNPWGASTQIRMGTGTTRQRPGSEPPLLSPYLSRGARFRHRLGAAFGDNATVRTDKPARPRPVGYEILAAPDDVEHHESNPSAPESSVGTDTGADMDMDEVPASADPSTHVTTQSPEDASPPAGPAQVVGEEQMHGWVVALQRLVKGKVRVNEEELEALSIILAEIESMKDGLDQTSTLTLELRESVKQLSKLYEIPFGDRNKLRQRADNMSRAWPSVGSWEPPDVLAQ